MALVVVKLPLQVLENSQASHLVTDGYSGYKRALSELRDQGKAIKEVYCNAHAFRYFRDIASTWDKEVEPFLELYGKIYAIEKTRKSDSSNHASRNDMLPLFESMRAIAEQTIHSAMPQSGFAKALNYFLNHYSGLMACVYDTDIPLDNNLSERLLRSPVVGRKTWYGTHSKKGAQTSGILFSLVATCKLNEINPRHYFDWVTKHIHQGGEPMTPYEYGKHMESR